MEDTGFVVGLELGTSKITGVVARRDESTGVLTILASETTPSDGCIKQGVIFNINEAAGKVKRIISLLANKIDRQIGSVYVTINGKSLHTVINTEREDFVHETLISLNLHDSLVNKLKNKKDDFFVSYSSINPQFKVNGVAITDSPIGKNATSIEATSTSIVGAPNIKNNLKRSLTDLNKLQVKSLVPGIMASSAILLSEEARNKGCVLIDLGAGTTSAAIFKEGTLKYMTVIPFGGRSITRDIQALGLTKEIAENYKIKYASLADATSSDQKKVKSEIDLYKFNQVVNARVDEIVENLINQLEASDHYVNLEAGVFLTGGGSGLSGIEQYISEKMGLPVSIAKPERIYINNASELTSNLAYSSVLGLLLFARENCEYKEPEKKPEPVVEIKEEVKKVIIEPTPTVEENNKSQSKKEGKVTSKLKGFIGSLFAEPFDEPS